jgi:hypothetical protein
MERRKIQKSEDIPKGACGMTVMNKFIDSRLQLHNLSTLWQAQSFAGRCNAIGTWRYLRVDFPLHSDLSCPWEGANATS